MTQRLHSPDSIPHPFLWALLTVALLGAMGAPAWAAGPCPTPAVANNTDCTVAPGTVITVTPASAVGLNASNALGQITGDGITVNLAAANTTAALALQGAVISFNNSAVNTTSTGAAANGQVGLRASGAGSTISATGASLRLSGAVNQNLRGAIAEAGGVISLTDTTVQLTGGSHALNATGVDSQINGTRLIASASGTNASVALADAGGTVTLTSSSITNTGASNNDNTPNAGVRALNGGHIVMNGSGSTITTTGLRGFGVSVEGAGSQAQIADTAIQVAAGRSFGISIKSGGVAQVNNSRVSINGTTGPFSPAVLVEGAGSTLTLTNSSVSTTTPTVATGVTARNGGSITVSDTTITTTGPNSAALSANGLPGLAGSVKATNVTITTSGDDNAMGAIADLDGNVTLNGGTITTSGNRVRTSSYAHALGARNPGGTLIANGTVATTSGLSAMGAWSDDGGTSTLNDVRITTSGELGIGVFAITEQVGAQFPANTTTNRTTVQTTGLNAHGAQAQSRNDQPVETATVTLNDSSITTQGTGAVGLRAVLEDYGSRPITGRGEANVVANRTTVLSQGVGAHGALSRDNPTSVTLNQTSIQATGATAHGAVAVIGGRIIGTDAQVLASGANSMALYALGTPAAVSTADFTRSTLTNSSGPNIGIAGNANVSLTDSSAQGSSEWLRVGTLTDFPPLPTAEPPLTGPEDFPDEETGDLPPLQSPPIAAPAPVVSPGLANVTLSGSTVVGSAFTAPGSVSNLTLTNNSLWRMTGDSNLTNLVNDPSLIQFSVPVGGVFKTLTVNNYSGDGAIGLHTFLAGDGSPSDKLVIDGGTATALPAGNTALLITNARDASGTLGPGALTTGNGILVVEAVNGGTTAANAFRLGNRAIAGPYEYTLQRSSVDASNGEAWYLRSTAEPTRPY